MRDVADALAQDQMVDAGDRFVAFIDFYASPFALGDILTWNMRVMCEALNAGKKAMDVVALTDPGSLGNASQCFFVTPHNYLRLYTDLIPAFYTNPMLAGFHHLRDRASFERRMGAAQANGQPMFPGLAKYEEGLRTREALYNRHHVMNSFHGEHGWLPRLTVPPSHAMWAENFLKSHNPEIFVVTVHVRRREAETHLFGAALDRDGDFGTWEAFFDEARRRHPETLFIVLGKSVEWPRRLMRRSDVIVLKALGLGLMEELAMIQASDLFMGLLSGPSTMAFFSRVPYSLFVQRGYEQASAEVMGVPVGEERLPFAEEDQIMLWEPATLDALLETFERQHAAWLARGGASGRSDR